MQKKSTQVQPDSMSRQIGIAGIADVADSKDNHMS
jgi:hypothetical protein